MAAHDVRPQIYWDESTRTWTTNGDRILGKVTWQAGDGVAVNIDGHILTLSELAPILSTHEGWYFELRFSDPTDMKRDSFGDTDGGQAVHFDSWMS